MKPYDKLKADVAEKIASLWKNLSGKQIELALRHFPITVKGQLVYASPAAPYIMVIRKDDGKLAVINWTQVLMMSVMEESKINF